MFLLPTLHRLIAALFTTRARTEDRFLSAASDAGDLERRLALLDTCNRERARGIVAGMYPR